MDKFLLDVGHVFFSTYKNGHLGINCPTSLTQIMQSLSRLKYTEICVYQVVDTDEVKLIYFDKFTLRNLVNFSDL